MSAFFVALLFSVGAGTWVYTKLQRRTGYGNGQEALKGAAIAGAIAFFVVLTVGFTLL